MRKIREWEEIRSTPIREGILYFFTKIFQGMQLHLLNTQTKFQVCICKTLDATSKKPILIAKFTKCKWTRNGRKFIHL